MAGPRGQPRRAPDALPEREVEQDRALYALCRPKRLMELARRYIVFDSGEKKIARYQQYFAIRDILAPPSSPKKARQTEAWLAEHYDGVLVHSDAGVVPLEASWPVTPRTAPMLHYTGFIAPPMPVANPQEREGAGEIIVTAGGGPVGRKLFETSIEAARMSGHRWRLLVGGGDAVALSVERV